MHPGRDYPQGHPHSLEEEPERIKIAESSPGFNLSLIGMNER